MARSYWNGNGKEQAKYDEMTAADFTFTQRTYGAFHHYYRYYNDGDLPPFARGYKGYPFKKYDGFTYHTWRLNEAGEEMLEAMVEEAILREYNRFLKAKKKA